MKTAEEYKNSLMWNGGNSATQKIQWILDEHHKEIIGLIDKME